MNAILLTDKSRLQEIYELRVAAYKDSPYSRFINEETYPEGYYDNLDSLETTYHWIVENDHQIVGSVRVAVIRDPKEMEEDLGGLQMPEDRPFAYCGRTVVDPQFRRTEAILKLDQVVRQFISENTWIRFGLCFVIPERINAVKKLGFHKIGEVEYDWGNQNKMILAAFIFERENL
jgi:predicted GNAT family N-acyltransferase